MKHVSSLTLSFLLFVFITNLSLAFSNDDVEQVLDINGNAIFPGGEYYILPALRGPGGG
ncbi:kunitz-type trypsin inhibitor-like 2 protein, partial [Trifolium medium]|nr:kunitz-type trypsin inhibitor-like 2 protein [Trifolium medium]